MKRWVVIIEQKETEDRSKDSVSCEGVFTNYKTAFGHVMDHIYGLRELYNEEGDIFEISDPYRLMNEAGECIKVMHSKFSSWDMPIMNRYYILEAPGEDE